MSPVPFIVVTPVKDEERHLPRTLASMAAQTWKPSIWQIVDDHSTDGTPGLLQQFIQEHPFARVLRRERSARRHTGVAEVNAFAAGYEAVRAEPHAFVVKLDADLAFPPDYFERLLRHFEGRPGLGIASGVYRELRPEGWHTVPMPSYHAAGASKVIRRKCFEEIGGFITTRGWDTVDEIRALARGWETTHFPDCVLDHLKAEGSGMGVLYTEVMHGEIFYRTGGGLPFFALKAGARLMRPPLLLGGLCMAWGFLRPWLARRELLVTREEAALYRGLLGRRLRAKTRLRAGA